MRHLVLRTRSRGIHDSIKFSVDIARTIPQGVSAHVDVVAVCERSGRCYLAAYSREQAARVCIAVPAPRLRTQAPRRHRLLHKAATRHRLLAATRHRLLRKHLLLEHAYCALNTYKVLQPIHCTSLTLSLKTRQVVPSPSQLRARLFPRSCSHGWRRRRKNAGCDFFAHARRLQYCLRPVSRRARGAQNDQQVEEPLSAPCWLHKQSRSVKQCRGEAAGCLFLGNPRCPYPQTAVG